MEKKATKFTVRSYQKKSISETSKRIDYFPLWRPPFKTEEKFYNKNKLAYKALRYSSSGFIAKPQVRDFIFKKYTNKCVFCGSKDNLQIDHIISVYKAFLNKDLIGQLNTQQNLQLLCTSCNAGKLP